MIRKNAGFFLSRQVWKSVARVHAKSLQDETIANYLEHDIICDIMFLCALGKATSSLLEVSDGSHE